ncbi:MAG: DUF5667 domain-containing protein [Patescibacteria group bacterium]
MTNLPDTSRERLDFIRSLRKLTLPGTIKEQMRLALSSYADLHALPERVPAASSYGFTSLFARTRSLYAGALATVLIIAGGTQASLASEGAVPGDVLYPVKVALAEPIAMTLAISSEQKAELSARFASRRVDEAAALSHEGKLDEETAEDLAVRFDTHVDALAKETEELEANGDIAVSLAVRTDLEQKVSDKADDIVIASASLSADAALLSDQAPEDRFSARIHEKSRTLATTRARLDSALALDSEATLDGAVDLAVLRDGETDPAETGDTPSSALFFAKDPSDAILSATLAATSTATTSAEAEAEEPSEEPAPSPAARFLAPFMNRP